MNDYNNTKLNVYDKNSIERYAQRMVGKTFLELIDDDSNSLIVSEDVIPYGASHENKNRKGGLGEIVEERFFHYKSNNISAPDFEEAGVELKTTPYKILADNRIVAKERLVLCMIDYNSVVNELDFFSSHFWNKSSVLLLVYYLWEKSIKNRLFYRIDYVRLFTPIEEDLKIIKNDYSKIVNKIINGFAHELSESDTFYLSACPKASDSSVRRSQPFSNIPAKPRAFAYKSSYMTYVLNNYIIGKTPEYERIDALNEYDDIERYVTKTINEYKGKTFDYLCHHFKINITKKPKNLGSMLALRMLNVNSNNAEEFAKANVIVKTIRVSQNGKIKESMSFPAFKFNEIISQNWEESDLYEMLNSTKFLFVVYKEDNNGEMRLNHAQFWNIPYSDLNTDVKGVFEKTKYALNHLPYDLKDEKGNNVSIFPKQSENRVCHVRPHARNAEDTYELPDGRLYTKQCFWLNNSYILEQIKDYL